MKYLFWLIFSIAFIIAGAYHLYNFNVEVAVVLMVLAFLPWLYFIIRKIIRAVINDGGWISDGGTWW